MSVIRRLAGVAIVTIGLTEGCGDDLGRAPYSWDASRVTNAPPGSDGGRDAPGDASLDGSDAPLGDASMDASQLDARTDIDLDVLASSDTDASIAADAVATEAGRDITALDVIDTGDTLRAALRAKSPSCLSCAQASCPGEFIGCSTIGGIPDAGRDAGATRSQLCVDTLGCLLTSSCEASDTSFCYCGDGGRGICWVPDIANGECKNKIERSFETTDPRRVLESLESADRDTGGGWAFLFARCLRDNGCATCFGRPDAGSDAWPAPDVSIDAALPPREASAEVSPPVPDVMAEAEASLPPSAPDVIDSAHQGADAIDTSSPPGDTGGEGNPSISDADPDAD